MSKELHKLIMKRSRLTNIFLKHRTNINQKKLQHSKKFLWNLLKITKNSYFENLDTKKITDNRSFSRTVQPLFTKNSSKGERINLVDDGKTIPGDEELWETFNQLFFNVDPSLYISKAKSFPMVSENFDPIISAIKSFDKHLRIVKNKKLKSLIQFFISEKLTVIKLERLSVIPRLKCLANKKIFPLRSLNWTKIWLLSLYLIILIFALAEVSFLLN